MADQKGSSSARPSDHSAAFSRSPPRWPSRAPAASSQTGARSGRHGSQRGCKAMDPVAAGNVATGLHRVMRPESSSPYYLDLAMPHRPTTQPPHCRLPQKRPVRQRRVVPLC
ncbi:hypothetical protein ZWY2020_037969 [Hordeum vulgare]|nr:hypothetical protein ZWY2020_037969 [Hordeum vulgare]